jgi:hypothetical protein
LKNDLDQILLRRFASAIPEAIFSSLFPHAQHKQSASIHTELNRKEAPMKELHLNIEEVIGLQVQEIAEWRWRKAEEVPDDPRNLEAAKELERLAAEIAQLNGSALHHRILELTGIVSEQGADDEAIDAIESTEAELCRVGFSGGFRTGAELLEWYRNELEDRLGEKSIDDDDDAEARSTPEAMAAEQAVKAAQQVAAATDRSGISPNRAKSSPNRPRESIDLHLVELTWSARGSFYYRERAHWR